ncbi:MAG: hypothetical protein K2P35_05455 [Lachnospiraceae bacterium]|nr:hypothetical protein [Lachnospiraceae bacterium]
MSDNELLLAISEMMDKKLEAGLKPVESKLDRMENRLDRMDNELQSVKNDLQGVKDDLQGVKDDLQGVKLFQENVILPRLNTIESCYTDTYDRYKNYVDKMDAVFVDVDLLKKVVAEHSEKLQKLA